VALRTGEHGVGLGLMHSGLNDIEAANCRLHAKTLHDVIHDSILSR
jgi:hypothetical protein